MTPAETNTTSSGSGGNGAPRHSIIRSSMVVSFCTAMSRLLGLVREILMGYFFGTTLLKSAFDVAFQIPNLFRNLFGEGALSSAFIPTFTETLEKEGREKALRMAERVLALLALMLTVLVAAGVLTTVVMLKEATFGEKTAQVLSLAAVMLPYVLCICLVAFSMGVHNTFGKFMGPASMPVLMNVVMILTIGVVAARAGDTAEGRIRIVAWGVVAGGAIQVVIQGFSLYRLGLRGRLEFVFKDAKVVRVLSLMMPAALGLGVFQANVLVDSLLAYYFVADWAQAALTYAQRLIYLPLGVFATALGTVLLPTYSRQTALEQNDELKATMNMAMRNLMLIMVPAAVGIGVLAEPIVRVIFLWKGGVFNEESVMQTTRALWFFAPGLLAFSMFKIIVPVFYAKKDTRTPVRVAVAMVVLNFCLNILFILTWPKNYQHAGLAFATVLASVANCVVLGIIFHKRSGSPGWAKIVSAGLKTIACGAVMGVGTFFFHPWLASVLSALPGRVKIQQVGVLGGAILFGIVVYGILASLLCRNEIGDFAKGLRGGRKRMPVEAGTLEP